MEYLSNWQNENRLFYFQNDNFKTTPPVKTYTSLEETHLPKFIQKKHKLQEQNLYYSQSSIDANTKHCYERLRESSTLDQISFRLEEFNEHLNKFPLSQNLANRLGTQKLVKNLGQNYPAVQGLAIEILGRLGYQEPLNTSPGIRILSIDGGGMKGK